MASKNWHPAEAVNDVLLLMLAATKDPDTQTPYIVRARSDVMEKEMKAPEPPEPLSSRASTAGVVSGLLEHAFYYACVAAHRMVVGCDLPSAVAVCDTAVACLTAYRLLKK